MCCRLLHTASFHHNFDLDTFEALTVLKQSADMRPMMTSSAAGVSRYFVLTSTQLYWFAAEPGSSLDFGACMGSMPTDGLGVLPRAHVEGTIDKAYSDVYGRMVRNEDTVQLTW